MSQEPAASGAPESSIDQLAADLELMHELAAAADELSMAGWRNPKLTVKTKPDGSVVTDMDLATEAKLREILAAARPTDAVLGEEQGLIGDPSARRQWIIDPIDGTANYARGRLGFGALIALAVDGTPMVGMISMPAYHQRWFGAVGIGSYDGDGPISVTDVTRIADGCIGISQPSIWPKRGLGDAMNRIRAAADDVYTSGDASLAGDLAAGRVEAAMVASANVWDLAASYAVIVAAGGVASDLAGQPRADGGSLIAASTPELHAEIMAQLAA